MTITITEGAGAFNLQIWPRSKTELTGAGIVSTADDLYAVGSYDDDRVTTMRFQVVIQSTNIGIYPIVNDSTQWDTGNFDLNPTTKTFRLKPTSVLTNAFFLKWRIEMFDQQGNVLESLALSAGVGTNFGIGVNFMGIGQSNMQRFAEEGATAGLLPLPVAAGMLSRTFLGWIAPRVAAERFLSEVFTLFAGGTIVAGGIAVGWIQMASAGMAMLPQADYVMTPLLEPNPLGDWTDFEERNGRNPARLDSSVSPSRVRNDEIIRAFFDEPSATASVIRGHIPKRIEAFFWFQGEQEATNGPLNLVIGHPGNSTPVLSKEYTSGLERVVEYYQTLYGTSFEQDSIERRKVAAPFIILGMGANRQVFEYIPALPTILAPYYNYEGIRDGQTALAASRKDVFMIQTYNLALSVDGIHVDVPDFDTAFVQRMLNTVRYYWNQVGKFGWETGVLAGFTFKRGPFMKRAWARESSPTEIEILVEHDQGSTLMIPGVTPELAWQVFDSGSQQMVAVTGVASPSGDRIVLTILNPLEGHSFMVSYYNDCSLIGDFAITDDLGHPLMMSWRGDLLDATAMRRHPAKRGGVSNAGIAWFAVGGGGTGGLDYDLGGLDSPWVKPGSRMHVQRGGAYIHSTVIASKSGSIATTVSAPGGNWVVGDIAFFTVNNNQLLQGDPATSFYGDSQCLIGPKTGHSNGSQRDLIFKE